MPVVPANGEVMGGKVTIQPLKGGKVKIQLVTGGKVRIYES